MTSDRLNPIGRIGPIFCLGSNRSTTYAIAMLNKAGLEVVQLNAPIADSVPDLIAGDAFPDLDLNQGTANVTRVWDCQCGIKGTGVQASAVSGASWTLGWPQEPPLTLPIEMPEKWCGVMGASLVLSNKFYTAEARRGKGTIFDVSAADILHTFASVNFKNVARIKNSWERNGRVAIEHGGIYPQGYFACADGYVGIVGRSRKDWEAILTALDNPPWAGEEMRDPVVLAQTPAKVDALFVKELAKYTRQELQERALQHGATIAPVYTRAEAVSHGIARPAFNEAGGRFRFPFDFPLSRPASPERAV